MGQPSLPVLQHGLLQGVVAVQNGNCCWKAVQRKRVALGKWGCVDPKIQFLQSVMTSYKGQIEY